MSEQTKRIEEEDLKSIGSSDRILGGEMLRDYRNQRPPGFGTVESQDDFKFTGLKSIGFGNP